MWDKDTRKYIYYLLIFDGFGIKLHSIIILLPLKVFIPFLLHFFTFLHEEQDKHLRIAKVMAATSFFVPSFKHGVKLNIRDVQMCQRRVRASHSVNMQCRRPAAVQAESLGVCPSWRVCDCISQTKQHFQRMWLRSDSLFPPPDLKMDVRAVWVENSSPPYRSTPPTLTSEQPDQIYTSPYCS